MTGNLHADLLTASNVNDGVLVAPRLMYNFNDVNYSTLTAPGDPAPLK